VPTVFAGQRPTVEPPAPATYAMGRGEAAVAVYAGDTEDGAEHGRPFRELGPAVNLVGDTP
jgi:hypothetical protein